MPIPPRTIRTLQDIRTHSGRASEGFVPYKAFMRLSCLEMEKYRRSQERNKALARVKHIEQRFADIEAEKTAILREMKESNESVPVPPPTGRQVPACSADVGSPLRFKY